MILKGKRVRLRPVKISDTKMLHRWINNKKVNRFLGVEIPISLAKEKKIVHKMAQPSKHYKHFIIEISETREPIGMMSIHHIDLHYRKATTGAYIALPKYWGKGYGSDAKMVLLKYAFLKLKLNRMVSHAYPHNPRSVAYSLKCGYKREGYMRENVIKKGRKYDSILLAVLKKDWLKVAKRKAYM
jgi:[ribosomal protein S5]-alanine N-acetyltransferase